MNLIVWVNLAGVVFNLWAYRRTQLPVARTLHATAIGCFAVSLLIDLFVQP